MCNYCFIEFRNRTANWFIRGKRQLYYRNGTSPRRTYNRIGKIYLFYIIAEILNILIYKITIACFNSEKYISISTLYSLNNFTNCLNNLLMLVFVTYNEKMQKFSSSNANLPFKIIKINYLYNHTSNLNFKIFLGRTKNFKIHG